MSEKFGVLAQKLASIMFLVTRILADGVRFLATAVIVQVITGWSIQFSVIIIGIVTLIYTLSGGIKTVVWMDSFQFVLYFGGGLIVIASILHYSGIEIVNSLIEVGKFNVFQLKTDNFITDPWFFFSAFIGGILLSFASHGSDHMMVQRVLSCKSKNDAQKAHVEQEKM